MQIAAGKGKRKQKCPLWINGDFAHDTIVKYTKDAMRHSLSLICVLFTCGGNSWGQARGEASLFALNPQKNKDGFMEVFFRSLYGQDC